MNNPIDQMPSNPARAERAHRVIENYNDDDDERANAIDLLTDVRHWCDEHGECYGDLDRIAHEHYFAELGEERGRL